MVIKGAKGRMIKGKSKALIDTKPSPMGERVVPRIDPALKAKAAAATKSKQKKKVSSSIV